MNDQLDLLEGWLKRHAANSIFQLFTEHGLDPFQNWLTMKMDKLDRSQLVEAAKLPEVRDSMQIWRAMMHARLLELESILQESKQ